MRVCPGNAVLSVSELRWDGEHETDLTCEIGGGQTKLGVVKLH